MKTYYDILGVSKGSNKKEIKAAYRKLVKRFHPDLKDSAAGRKSSVQSDFKNNNTGNSKIFEEITAAYNTLIHPEKKMDYDKSLAAKKQTSQILVFKFRELREWLYSVSFVKIFLRGKNIVKHRNVMDTAIMEIPLDELLKMVIFSRNIYVQINAVRAILARNKHYAVFDLLRLLYSSIDDSVKIEIIEGLKNRKELRVKKVIREIYDIEKSLKVKQLIRSIIKI